MNRHPAIETMRQARKARGWSQADLAQVSGASESAISGWEVGDHQPTVDRLAAVLGALDHQLLAVPATGRAWLLLVEVDEGGQPVAARAIPNNGYANNGPIEPEYPATAKER